MWGHSFYLIVFSVHLEPTDFTAQPLSWDGYLQHIRDLEKMLAPPFTREQFVSQCIGSVQDEEPFKTWGARLKGLRWEAVTAFCSEDSRLSAYIDQPITTVESSQLIEHLALVVLVHLSVPQQSHHNVWVSFVEYIY